VDVNRLVLNTSKMAKIKIWLGISLVLLGLLIIVSRPDNKPRIIFCDVGQGDGMILMQGSWQLLVDTGPENGKMGICLGKYLPFWDKKLEAVIITHGDSDHAGGLKQIEKSYQLNKRCIQVIYVKMIDWYIRRYKLRC